MTRWAHLLQKRLWEGAASWRSSRTVDISLQECPRELGGQPVQPYLTLCVLHPAGPVFTEHRFSRPHCNAIRCEARGLAAPPPPEPRSAVK